MENAKIMVIDEGERTIVSIVKHTGAEHRRLASQVMKEAMDTARLNIDDITYIVATGYGRINVPFADCHFTELQMPSKLGNIAIMACGRQPREARVDVLKPPG